MKLTKEQIEKIQELKEKGLRPYQIAKELNLKFQTVLYHYNEEFRKKAIKRNLIYQKKNPPKRTDKLREYQREYHKARYWRLKNGK